MHNLKEYILLKILPVVYFTLHAKESVMNISKCEGEEVFKKQPILLTTK